MAKFKFKISSGASKKEIAEYLLQLKNHSQNEIPFSHILKVAGVLGFIHQLKSKRGKGSQERFYHPKLESNRYFHGYVGVHVIHKGGSKILVKKRDFVKFLYPIFVEMLK